MSVVVNVSDVNGVYNTLRDEFSYRIEKSVKQIEKQVPGEIGIWAASVYVTSGGGKHPNLPKTSILGFVSFLTFSRDDPNKGFSPPPH